MRITSAIKSICLSILYSSIPLIANGRAVTGNVTDDESQPLSECLVSVYDMQDSICRGYCITPNDGSFNIDVPDDYDIGKLYIAVAKNGWENITFNVTEVPLQIVLRKTAQELDTLTVTAKKGGLSYKNGRILYDPKALEGHVDNGAEIIEKMPLVIVDKQSVKIFGKGKAEIYINGKKPKLTEDALWGYLESIPSSYVKSVQIVTERGSAVNSRNGHGIVNLIIDDERIGSYGFARLRSDYLGERISPSATLYYNYAQKKYQLNFCPYFKGINHLFNELSEYKYPETGSSMISRYKEDDHYNILGISSSFGYQFTNTKSIGAYVTIGTYSKDVCNTTDGESFVGDIITEWTDRVQSKSPDYRLPSINAGVFSDLEFGRNLLNLSANFSNSRMDTGSIYSLHDSSGFIQNDSERNTGFALNADYTLLFQNGGNLSAGFETFTAFLKENAQSLGDAGIYGNNLNMTLWEIINSLYVKLSHPIGKYINLQFGIRGEHYDRKVDFDGKRYIHNEINLFPSASISFSIPNLSQYIGLSYSTSSTPIYYMKLNPEKKWTSSNTYKTGNPYLPLSYIHSLSLSYNILDTYSFSCYYSKGINFSEEYTINNGDYIESGYAADFKNDFLRMCLGFSKQVSSFLMVKADTGISYSKGKATLSENPVEYEYWDWTMGVRLFFDISRRYKIKIQLGGEVSSPHSSLSKKTGWHTSSHLTIQKIFGNWGEIRGTVGNLLYDKSNNWFASESFERNTRQLGNPMNFSLTFGVYLGKMKSRQAETRSSSSITSRLIL